MEPFLAIVRRHRPDLFPAGSRGWGGCRCGCHGPRPVVKHLRACCQPSREEFDAIVELYRERGEAYEELHELLDGVSNETASTPLGMLSLVLAMGGR